MTQRVLVTATAIVIVLLAGCTSEGPQTAAVTRIAEVTPTASGETGQKNEPAAAPSQRPSQQAQPPSSGATIAATASVVRPSGPISSDSPRLLFTDLESGPNTGGQDNLGAFITIYGEGFGAGRGSSTVTMGGKEVAKYVSWGQDNASARKLDMIVVQPGSNAASGEIVVTVNGKASNPLPFTMRAGKIYFVSQGASNANDANAGTLEAPFKTIYKPREVLQPGDIVYIKGGTFSAADPKHPGWDAILLLTPDTDANGTADRPIAYVGYPGDRPVLGAPQPMRRGIYMEETTAHYVIANLEFSQYAGNLNLSGNGHRIVGNYFHDVTVVDGAPMGVAGNSAHYRIFGNLLRHNGDVSPWEDGIGFYIQGFGTNQDIDFGWNQILDQGGRRAIQLFGHVAGDRLDNIRIHDNLLSGSLPLRNNILLGGSDGGTEVLGTVYIYNNIIVGAGGQGLRVNDPQGTVIIQHNVLYNNGSLGFDGKGQLYIEQAGSGKATLQNNIVYAGPGQTYYDFGTGVAPSALKASNNLWYNGGKCPPWDVGCVSADPGFVDLASGDFRLKAGSPAINAGVRTDVSLDFAGVSRPQGNAPEIGAFEFDGSR